MAISARTSILWMAICQGMSILLHFGATVVVARLLSPYEMGVFAAATAVVGLLTLLRMLGLAGFVIRAKELTPDLLASVFTINTAISLTLAGGILLAGLLGGILFGDDGVRQVLNWLVLVPLLNIFEFAPTTRMERDGRFAEIAAIGILRIATTSSVLLYFAFTGHSYMSLAYGQVAGMAVGLLAFHVVAWRYAVFRFSLSGWREVMRYGIDILAISGTNYASSRLAEIVLARMLGLPALGLYSRATGLANLFWENVQIVISRVLFVDFSEQRRRGLSLRDSYLRIVSIMMGILWPLFAGLAVIAGPAIVVLYGEKWADAHIPLSLLSIACLPLVAIAMPSEIFIVCERTRQQVRFEFARATAGFVIFTIGCTFGLAGAAFARILEGLLAFLIYRPHLRQMTDTTERDYLPIYLRSLALTLSAVTPAAFVMVVHGWSPFAPIGQVLGAVAAGMAAWVVTAYLQNHVILVEAHRLLAQLGLVRAQVLVRPGDPP